MKRTTTRILAVAAAQPAAAAADILGLGALCLMIFAGLAAAGWG